MEFSSGATDYSVTEFYEHFHNGLPVIVKVTQGFFGKVVEDTFDRDQVMRLQTVSRQRRVVARMTQGHSSKLISIPISYSGKFCIVNHHEKSRRENDLDTIVKENILPLMVQFPKDSHTTVNNQAVRIKHIPKVELLKTFEEMYILGNFIIDGEISQEVVHVPLYLSQLRIAVVTGIVGRTKEEWAEYRDELDRACASVSYDQDFGNPDIAEYDPKAVHSHKTYSYIEPQVYSTIGSLMQTSSTRSFEYKLLDPENQQTSKNIQRLYEAVCNTNENKKALVAKFMPSTSQINRKMSDQSSESCFQSLDLGDHVPLECLPPPIAPRPTKAVRPDIAPVLPMRQRLPVIPRQPSEQNIIISVNDKPRRYIDSTPHKEEHGRTTDAQMHCDVRVEVRLTEVNCPDDIVKLSITEVSEYLKKLNLDHFIESFKTEMIDGILLRKLDEEILTNDFGMKMIEALRLMTFANTGHVPT